MKKLVITCAIVLTLGAELASAGDYSWGQPGKNLVPVEPPIPGNCLTYDYVDLQYVGMDLGSAFLDNAKGLFPQFLKGHGSSMYITGAYERAGYDYDWVNHVLPVDTNRYRLGIGAYYTVKKCFDITLEGGAQYLTADYETARDHDYDSWGWYAGPGFRTRVGNFELFANAFYGKHEGDFREEYLSHANSVQHDRVDDYFWRFTPGMVYYITENVGLKAAAEFERDDTSYLFGVRIAY